jgi:hypothetical protein
MYKKQSLSANPREFDRGSIRGIIVTQVAQRLNEKIIYFEVFQGSNIISKPVVEDHRLPSDN